MLWTIIASGPSLTHDQVCKAEGKIMVINNSWTICHWADALFASDCAWWRQYYTLLVDAGFQGELWTKSKTAADQFGLNWIQTRMGSGLCKRNTPPMIHLNGTSGYGAINLAYHLGATEIHLLGYDYNHDGETFHFFGNHPEPLGNPRTINSNREAFIDPFNQLAEDLKQEGVKVINDTPGSALECFEYGY